jgi:hypothetical protein
MSAVKRVFTHSAIRSAIRKPFVPNDDGYREYLKRSVFELNGTQWGKLSEPILLSGDFEIEVKYLKSGTSTTTFFGGKLENINCVAMDFNSNRLRAFAYDANGDISSVLQASQTDSDAAADGRVHIVRLVYVSGQASIIVDGKLVAEGYWGLATPVEVSQVLSRTLNGFRLFVGVVFDFKIWTNGDRDSGDLILDVPFDEAGTDYQRNRAVVGSFVDANRNWYYQGDLIGDSDLIEIDFPSGDSGPAATASGSVFDPGKSYEVIYDVLSLSAGGSVRLNHGSNGVQDEPYNDTAGIKTAYVIANGSGNGTMQFYALADTQAQIRIISIREWSGVILQSALPEDWMQIERKRWWDYWLGKSLTTLSNSGGLDIARNVLKSGDTYTRNSSDQSCYIGKTLIPAGDEGEKRLISLQARISNLSNSALYIPIRLQNQYPARVDVSFTREGGIHIPTSYSSDTDIELHELSAEVESDDLVINILVETSQRLSFYISPRNEATGDLDNADPDTTVSFDFGYVSATIRRKLEIAQ